jgi:hypothetical protein
MSRALPLLLLACGACVNVDSTTRVERGPLLRTFDREQIVEGGVRGSVTAQWPKLYVALEGHDTCRSQKLEEYAEEHTTERSSTEIGAALSTGIACTLAGAGLLAASPLVSGEPNRKNIDSGGHYGASDRQLVQGWSIVTLAVGVPALVVGVIGYLRQGSVTEVKKVEQVAGQKEVECRQRDVDGPVQLMSEQHPAATGTAIAGSKLEFDESSLMTVGVDRVLFFGREVELDDASRRVLDGFSACRQLQREQVATAGALSTGALMNRLERVRACRLLRPEAMAQEGAALEAEVAHRREGGDPGAFPVGPNVTGFEEAVSAYAPRLTLSERSEDLSRLDAIDEVVGQAAVVEGIVTEGVTANIGVLQVGNRRLFLFLPSQRAWGGDFPPGTRVEAVAVVVGEHTLGNQTLPLLRAVFMRPAFGP